MSLIFRTIDYGVGERCGCRALGTAINPVRRESRIISGVAATQITNASSSGHRPGSSRSRSVLRKSTLKKSFNVSYSKA